MSPINKAMMGALILVWTASLAGCGSSTPNSRATFNSDKGQHISGWLPAGHAQAAQADSSSCFECHGSDLSGGMSKISCFPCHINGSPFALTNCTSCHGNPPTGTAFPNQSGAHPDHNALPNVKSVCSTCHNGAGSGTVNHDNGVVDVAFLSAYNAKSGTAVYNSDGTCSEVSCHGGQKTPVWLSGFIDVNTQCTSCHAFGTSEYTSFVSGQHDFHVNVEHFPCDKCHDTVKLSVNHFTSLNTPVMEGPASATVLSSLTYTNGTCTPLCHGTESW